MNWDKRSGVRERLYLLTRIGNGNPGDWIYNSRTDRWSNGSRGFKVEMEAQESLLYLQRVGLAETAALEMVK